MDGAEMINCSVIRTNHTSCSCFHWERGHGKAHPADLSLTAFGVGGVVQPHSGCAGSCRVWSLLVVSCLTAFLDSNLLSSYLGPMMVCDNELPACLFPMLHL